MKASAMASLCAADLRARWGRNLTLALAIAIGCAALTLIATAALRIRRVVVEDVIESFPATQIEVKQKQVSFLFLKFGNPAGVLSEEMMAKVAGIPGVAGVQPEVLCPFPAIIDVRLVGTAGFVTETCIFGVRREFVADSLKPGVAFAKPAGDAPVPAVISKALIGIFNTGFAPSRGLPKFDESLIVGREFDLYLGGSTMTEAKRVAKKRVKIVGISPRVSLVGITVPEAVAHEWNAWWFRKKDLPKQYHRLIVSTTSPRDVDRVAKRLEAMGLAVSTKKGIADGLNSIVRLLDGLVAGLSVAVFVLMGVGVLNVAALDTAERTGWIGLLRACGATRLDVAVMSVVQLGLVGGVGGLLGAGGAGALAVWLDRVAAQRLPAAGVPAIHVFAGWWQVGLAVAFAAGVLAAVAALLPAWCAGRLDPALALKRE